MNTRPLRLFALCVLMLSAVSGFKTILGAAPPAVTSATLTAWLDATDVNGDSTMPADGAAVTTWVNKAAGGIGDFTVGGGGIVDPSYTALSSAFKNLPVVHFTAGSARWLANPVDLGNNVTVIFVGRKSGADSGRLVSAIGNNWLLGYWGYNMGGSYWGGPGNYLGRGTADNEAHVWVGSADGTQFQVFLAFPGSETLVDSGGMGQGPNGLSLGTGFGDAAGGGDIAEVLVYNGALSQADRLSVEAYLADKWMSSSTLFLQSGSPYSSYLETEDAPDYTLLWEGARLMGTGTLTEWSFFSRLPGRTITPLLFKETAGNCEVVGVGTARTSMGSGAYEVYPFGLLSGSAAVCASDGSRYYLGFSVSDSGSPIAYNNNGLDNQGMTLRYAGGYTTATGPVSFAGAVPRHYALRAKVEQDAPVVAVRGETLMRRLNADSFPNGFIVDRTPIGAMGVVSRWVGFARVDPSDPAVTRELTPVVFRESGGAVSVYGIGQTRALGDGFFEYDFDLQAGSAVVAADANYLLGWRYGRMDGSAGAAGSLSFSFEGEGDVTPSDLVSYFDPGAVAVGVGYAPVFAGTQPRNYSFSVLVVPKTSAPVITSLAFAWGVNQLVGRITFDTPLDPVSATNTANYSFDGGPAVTSASLSGDTVTLGLSGLAPYAAYSLNVSGVQDVFGVTMAATNLSGTVPFYEVNWARAGSASMSTVFEGYAAADRATDGNTSGNWFDWSIAANADGDTERWWEVDLGDTKPIGGVRVWWRTDCCPERATDSTVKILDAAREVVWSFTYPGVPPSPAAMFLPPVGTSGRIVRFEPGAIERTGSEIFQLAEVQVIAPYQDVSIAPTLAPDDQLALEGGTATFGPVAATLLGAPAENLVVQWQWNGANVPGANATTFTTPELGWANNGDLFGAVFRVPGLAVTGAVAILTVNRPPVAGHTNAGLAQNHVLVIQTADLLALGNDPDGDPVAILSADPFSIDGGSVVLGATTLTYTPLTDYVGPDQFSYTVSDGRGGTAVGRVSVDIYPGTVPALNMLSIQKTGGGIEFTFAGIPGRSYGVERAMVVTGPWTNIATVVAEPNGITTYLDNDPPPGAGYYRTRYP